MKYLKPLNATILNEAVLHNGKDLPKIGESVLGYECYDSTTLKMLFDKDKFIVLVGNFTDLFSNKDIFKIQRELEEYMMDNKNFESVSVCKNKDKEWFKIFPEKGKKKKTLIELKLKETFKGIDIELLD